MAITSVEQQGSLVKVYDGSKMLFSRHATLIGYTSSSVTIEENGWVKTFDETERLLSSEPK